MIKFYNSMTNKIEEFKPIKEGKVSLYVCGPTVYGYAHFGNMRPVIVFDTLRRFLTYLGYEVTYVSNITDVDDKVINSAIKEGKSESEIASFYLDNFLDCVTKVNSMLPNYMPRVTENMDAMISFINELVIKGYAYVVDGDVFFRVSKAKEYGKLGNFKVEDLKVGARVEENIKKESPLDFALWKKTDKGVKWNSFWGEGRPGWHTECVVMINSIFKQHLIDIHGGGFDLKFPHHENEIAQSRACYNTYLANYWMHNGFVNFNNEKMSKSIGNVKFAKDVIEQYGGQAVRFAMLSTHYRSPFNFNDEIMGSAIKEVSKITMALNQASVKMQLNEKEYSKIIDDSYIARFIEELSNDLNTANALTIVFEVTKELNLSLRKNDMPALVKQYYTLLDMINVLGISYEKINVNNEDKALFNNWKKLKLEGNYEEADKIRTILSSKGIM